MISIKSQMEIEAMKESGRILATVLDLLCQKTVIGITTKEIAEVAKKEVKKMGGQPAFLGYSGFPDVICISVNDEVVHGLPSKYVIKAGDIISYDFGVIYKGMITDSARSILVDYNENDRDKQRLLKGTKKSLDNGIKAATAGAYVGDIGFTIQTTLESYNLGIVRDLVGHGVGKTLHEDPDIPNYGQSGTGQKLVTGMTIAIEPMATLGSYELRTAENGWAIITKDNSLAAHFEDTILITDQEAEILTRL